MKDELKIEIKSTFGQLYQTLSLFTSSEINAIPFENSWTSGQVARHIIKATSGLKQVCDNNTKKIAVNPEEKVPALKQLFLDFSTKMNSPEFIYPEVKEYDKERLLSTIQDIEKELLDIAENYDLGLTCLNFEMPGFGNLTIYELVSFAVVHTKRHIYQLTNIYKALRN
jgi:hypothetical protein